MTGEVMRFFSLLRRTLSLIWDISAVCVAAMERNGVALLIAAGSELSCSWAIMEIQRAPDLIQSRSP